MYSYDPENKVSFDECWRCTQRQADGALCYIDDKPYLVNHLEAAIWGSRFLSGFQDDWVVCFHGDNSKMAAIGVCWGKDRTHAALPVDVQVASTMPICLSGAICSDPSAVASFVRRYPSNRIFVCPVIEELESLGALVIGLLKRDGKLNPCRVSFYRDCVEKAEGTVIQEYDDTLKGDNLGRMATALRLGVPVVNQVRRGIGISPFYDRVLSLNMTEGKEKICLVRSGDLERFFPKEPPSLWMESSICVPVEGLCSDEFRSVSGLDVEKVVFFAMSDWLIGATEFMNFVLALTNKRIVASAPMKMMSELGNTFLFRYNEAYKM